MGRDWKADAKRVLRTVATCYVLGSIAVGIVLAQIALHPKRFPVTGERAMRHWSPTVGAAFEPETMQAFDGAMLHAWYVRPANSSSGAVLLLHGVSDTREGMIGFAQLFVQHGYTVLLPDSRAHGESGGTIATYGIRERDDVGRWARWLANREGRSCVFGFGESMGAGLILQSLDSGPFCAVVAESGFATFRQASYDRVAGVLKIPLWMSRTVMAPAIETGFLYARIRYGIWMGSVQPIEVVRRSRVPVLLIHGQADTNLLPRESRMMAAANPDVVLWEVPRAEHCGAFAVAGQEFERRVLGWFAAHGPARVSVAALTH